jgi:hypothetical protein
MTSPSFSLQPPRLAVWLVNLFTLPDNAEAIMGDLLEESSQIAHQAGVVSARRWYWRQEDVKKLIWPKSKLMQMYADAPAIAYWASWRDFF